MDGRKPVRAESALRSKSWTIALCALLCALGAALMTAGGLIPVATYCTPLLAGLLLLPVPCEFSRREAWMVWAVTSALTLMLSPDREAGAMYLFLGWYPIVKPAFDRIRPPALSVLAKLLLFAAAFAAMYAVLLFVLQLAPVIEEMQTLGLAMELALDAMLIVVMLLYDFLLARLRILYLRRLRPRLGRMLRRS